MQDEDWHISRKSFIRSIMLGGMALQLPWLQSCSSDNDGWGDLSPLNENQFKTLRAAQNVLFPEDGNGPGALQVNADRYLLWVLNDQLLDPDENNYIIKQLNKFSKACKTKYSSEFHELDEDAQTNFVMAVSQLNWGEKWFSRLLTLIFEALLLDPVYGGNANNSGWTWLEHDPGFPRPEQKTTYPQILERRNEV